MGLPQFHADRGPIAETLGLVWHARTNAFPDSGLMHIAAASPGGVVGLFAGPSFGPPVSRRSPPGLRVTRVEAQKELPSEQNDAVLASVEPRLAKPSLAVGVS